MARKLADLFSRRQGTNSGNTLIGHEKGWGKLPQYLYLGNRRKIVIWFSLTNGAKSCL